MFRLLPVQILMSVVGAVNGFVSSYFASNFVSVKAVSAVGIYGPVGLLVGAISTMLVGGAVVMCGKYIGENRKERSQNVFALSLLLSSMVAVLFTVLFVVFGLFDLTGFLTRDAELRPLFNRYLLGQSVGVFPSMIGNLLFAFLSLENKTRRGIVASVAYAFSNIVLTYLFVCVFRMGEFGLALASSLGMWAYCGVEASYFLI